MDIKYYISLSNDIKESNNQFCSEAYVNFFYEYNKIDPQVKTFLCGIGFIANVFNILIFTRPKMRNPLNTILTALAFADGLFLLTLFTTYSLMWIRLANGDLDTISKTGFPFYWCTSRLRAVEYAIHNSFYYVQCTTLYCLF